MSINACSINEFTINTLCGRRRSAIIAELLKPPVVQTGGGSQQHVNPNTKIPLSIFRRDHRRDEEDIVEDVRTLEQEYVEVSIEMAGQRFTQTLKQDAGIPMINVSSVRTNRLEEQVNISEFKIRIT
jgi:hypothetical protein